MIITRKWLGRISRDQHSRSGVARLSIVVLLALVVLVLACGSTDGEQTITETSTAPTEEITSISEPAATAETPAATRGTPENLENPKPLTNGDFETGDLSGWTADVVDSSWGNWFIYEDGDTAPTSDDRKYSYNVFELPDPPQGTFAAASDSAGAGRYILYQDFTVESPVVLRLVVYYRSQGDIHAPQHFDLLGRNDQFRVDVIDTSAAIDSLAEDDVFGTLFQNEESDPSYLGPTEVSLDLSAFVGQTVRLRIVQIDNSAAFMSGFDNVRLEPVS